MTGIHWIIALLALLVVALFYVFTMPSLEADLEQQIQKQQKVQYESWGSPSKTMRHPK